MVEIKIIDEKRKEDINIKNEPFEIRGRLCPSLSDGVWSYTVRQSDSRREMRFPDENYDYDLMKKNCVFLGAYDGEVCVGLAVLQEGLFKYMYLYDLKVNRSHRRCGIGKMLMKYAERIAIERGYEGIYTIAQDDNLSAALFYLNIGFAIRGFDTGVYKGTNQEGKSDIILYRDIMKDATE